MLAVKTKALQSLSQGESTSFSWKDFKRAYKTMKIWIDCKRITHIRRVRDLAMDTLEEETKEQAQ